MLINTINKTPKKQGKLANSSQDTYQQHNLEIAFEAIRAEAAKYKLAGHTQVTGWFK